MNTMQRMRQTNAIIKKELKKQGYYDIVMFPHTRHFKDVWGLFDGVCKEDGQKDKVVLPDGEIIIFDYYVEGAKIVWLQFKTGYATKRTKNKMKKFCKQFGEIALLCELIKKRVKYKNKKGSHEKREVKITRY